MKIKMEKFAYNRVVLSGLYYNISQLSKLLRVGRARIYRIINNSSRKGYLIDRECINGIICYNICDLLKVMYAKNIYNLPFLKKESERLGFNIIELIYGGADEGYDK